MVEHLAVQFIAQVSPHLFELFHCPLGDCQRVAGDPQPAARPGTGATEHRFFFHHDDVEAKLGAGDGTGQARGA
ncbi:hypothetical protein D3C81_2106920 [compost metagenome]